MFSSSISCAISARVSHEPAGNVWNAGTLEWLPNDLYRPAQHPATSRAATRSGSSPTSRSDVEAARFYLPNAPTGVRETIITSPIEAAPQYLQRLPGPGWSPFLAAIFTAAFFMLLTVKLVDRGAVVRRALAIAFILDVDLGQRSRTVWAMSISAAASKCRPMSTGPVSHAWWAVVILMLVAGSLYLAFVFSYLYLWTVAPQGWSSVALPASVWPIAAAASLAVAAASGYAASRLLRQSRLLCALALLVALGSLSASLWLEIAGHWQSGLRPEATGYAALVYLGSALQLQIVAALVIMGLDLLARLTAGRADNARRVTFDCLALLIYYAAGQGLLGLLLVHGFPRAVA